MLVTLIAAVAENGTIGRNNDLPWTIKDDMRFFVRTTKGHTVISGRKNFEAMGRALPKRRNIVVTRQIDPILAGLIKNDSYETAPSVAHALRSAAAAQENEAFVIGGAQIYQAAFPFAHRFYRTRVLAEVVGDVVFPEIDLSNWDKSELLSHEPDADNEYGFIIEQWDRRDAPTSFHS